MSGALVRLPMLQRQRDRCGLNTGGFISGYRGSLARRLRPGAGGGQEAPPSSTSCSSLASTRERLAPPAVGKLQMLDLYPQSKKYDGVFGIWYGKGRAWTASGRLRARQHTAPRGTAASSPSPATTMVRAAPPRAPERPHLQEPADCRCSSQWRAGHPGHGAARLAMSRFSGV